jgi:hypothetical protein
MGFDLNEPSYGTQRYKVRYSGRKQHKLFVPILCALRYFFNLCILCNF